MINDNELLISLKPRYFTPKEIANLHAFPDTLKFPDSISKLQKWKLLGNSLNVEIISVLIKQLLFEFNKDEETTTEIVENEQELNNQKESNQSEISKVIHEKQLKKLKTK